MRSPNAKNTGFQYTPVDSMPASSTRSATSQSPSSSNPPAVVGNVRVATRRDRPAPGVRTVTTTVTVHIQPRAALDQLLHHIHPDIGIPVPVFGHRDAVGVQSCQSRSSRSQQHDRVPQLRAPYFFPSSRPGRGPRSPSRWPSSSGCGCTGAPSSGCAGGERPVVLAAGPGGAGRLRNAAYARAVSTCGCRRVWPRPGSPVAAWPG